MNKHDPITYRGWEIIKSALSEVWFADQIEGELTLRNRGIGYPDVESVREAIDKYEDGPK